jgi:membrane-bound metal-dependent hydrolase YbcI (DUF457 family)
MLPDLLTRPAYILFPDLFWFVFPLHTPLVLLFVCYACSFFFEEVHRQCVFTALFAGAFGHILLDFIQKSFTLSYAPLFPFSYARFSLNLLDPDDTLLLIPVLLVVIAGVWLARHIKNKGITNASH